MELNFKKNVNIEINNDSEEPEGYSFSFDCETHEVLYVLSFETREWGIKGFSLTSPDQKICISIPMINKDHDYTVLKFNISVKNIETEYQNERSLSDDIAPEILNLILRNIVKVVDEENSYTADADGCLYF